MVNLTDAWKAFGSPGNKRPNDWKKLPTTQGFIEAVAGKCELMMQYFGGRPSWSKTTCKHEEIVADEELLITVEKIFELLEGSGYSNKYIEDFVLKRVEANVKRVSR